MFDECRKIIDIYGTGNRTVLSERFPETNKPPSYAPLCEKGNRSLKNQPEATGWLHYKLCYPDQAARLRSELTSH
jgi:hypothetical protein